MARKVSSNHTKTCWVLKCDIRKFFASIDHQTLFKVLEKHISDKGVLWLLHQVVTSFHAQSGKGLPLGNLTSQLLVNVYMNEFDQWVKHTLKAKYYVRYADDFVFMSQNKSYLEDLLCKVEQFLVDRLLLQLHPHKVSISTVASGVDFLDWVHFPHHRVLRTVTKRRMLKNIQGLQVDSPVAQSYLSLLDHGNTQKLRQMVIKDIFGHSIGTLVE